MLRSLARIVNHFFLYGSVNSSFVVKIMKGNLTNMTYKKGHRSAFIALLLLAGFALACGVLKNDLDQANKLVGEANDELKAVQKIEKDSEDKIREFKKALDDREVDKVKSSLGDLIKMIDEGLEHGRKAADKVKEASNLNVGDKFKKYLELKAESFQKQVDAFEARKKSAEVFRNAYGSSNDAQIDKAKEEFTKQTETYKRLMEQAKDLSDQADKIQRENPDKIKSTSDK